VATLDEVFGANVFIFDCVTMEGKAVSAKMSAGDVAMVNDLVTSFVRLVDAEQERARSRSGPPRRVVMINAIENRFETLVRKYLDYARTPFSARLRHGFIRGEGKRGPLNSIKEHLERRFLRRWITVAAHARKS